MNTLKNGISLCCLLYLSAAVHGQRPTPVVNGQGQLRHRIYVPLATLDKVFSASRDVSLQLDDSLKIKGMVLSKQQVNSLAVSVNIEIEGDSLTHLSVSKAKQEDGTFRYQAHLVRKGSSEIWSLEEEKGSYYFVSTPRAWVIAD